ncbi:hypothetical protein QNN00_02640 [Bacillus velezensis]|nr:hypothetical protein [Bacillus velezensis]
MDIKIKDVEHRYQMKTPFERLALYDINAVIKRRLRCRHRAYRVGQIDAPAAFKRVAETD